MSCGCSCGGDCKTQLLYSCSGSANTGELADRVFRKMKQAGFGSGTCLAAIGADLSGFIQSAREASRNIVLDGCPAGCGRKIFESRNIPFTQVVITGFGVEKGKTEITDELVNRVTSEVLGFVETA